MYYRFLRINDTTMLFVIRHIFVMLDRKFYFFAVFSFFLLIPLATAEASHNPNLFVSAENPKFNNHFSGSMVVEVVVNNPNLINTDQGKGEPDVTVNGKTLRMVQATDGKWYGYFANVDKAKIADSTVGLAGQGLDFGVFCSRNTASSVFGISLSETDGFAVPPSAGLTASTNGVSSFVACTGTPTNPTSLINVVKNPKSINQNSNVPTGQIGLNPNAWPLIQLYSFDSVTIQYNPGGPSQKVTLEYDEIPNVSFSIDRNTYPKNAEVFLTINDFQLNQDPTKEDSWTFNIESPVTTFYQAFDNAGNNAANGNAGLVNLVPHLSALGFEDNGKLSISLGDVLELQTNNDQPDSAVDTDGVSNTFSKIVTLVEQGPNSGIFESFDSNDQSVLGILADAPRGKTGQITYNKNSLSVLTGFSTASVSLDDKPVLTVGNGGKLNPGTKYPVTLVDPDQNLNTGARDHLDVFRDTAIIPTISIGNPVTLGSASNVKFHASSPVLVGGDDADSSVPDSNSDRLIIDSSTVANGSYEMISMNLGIPASSLIASLLDVSESNTSGTNWINYDLRSFANDLGISDFSDTSFTFSFGTLGTSPITIADAGDISDAQGFIQIDDSDVQDISDESGTVFLVIDFDSSSDDAGVLSVSSETNDQPIVFDLFSFGLQNDKSINKSIYRFELEETKDNSSTFQGTFEYAVANQLNIVDPNFIKTIQPIDDQIKIIVTNRLIDEKGVAISYSDLDAVGVITQTSSKSNLSTNSGVVSTTSSTFRFGQPVTITLIDLDLNLKSDQIDVYSVINDPNSVNVDTVGKDGEILLEIKLKDTRYKRCTIDGTEYGGLAATGFTLVETGPSTGIFQGVFKMPSQICDKTGTKLISTAGGSLDARYHDSRDASGNPNIFSLLSSKNTVPYSIPAKLSQNKVSLPSPGLTEEIILSGSIENHKRGTPLSITLTNPDGTSQNFAATLSNGGNYKSVFTVNHNSPTGTYRITLSHDGKNVGTLSFSVISEIIPDWIKNNARWWSSDSISDDEFIDGLEHLIDQKIISVEPTERSTFEQEIPKWIKNNAKWWAENHISEEEFLKSIQYLVKKGIIRV